MRLPLPHTRRALSHVCTRHTQTLILPPHTRTQRAPSVVCRGACRKVHNGAPAVGCALARPLPRNPSARPAYARLVVLGVVQFHDLGRDGRRQVAVAFGGVPRGRVSEGRAGQRVSARLRQAGALLRSAARVGQAKGALPARATYEPARRG